MNVTSLPTHCLGQLPSAVLKATPEDFQVDEILGFEPDGEGNHLWINIRKCGKNTRDVADEIASAFSIAAKDVGYSGLKDKNAVTTQWFSLPLSGGGVSEGLMVDSDDLRTLVEKKLSELTDIDLVTVTRSRKKLRSGAHRTNQFKIVLREVEGTQELINRQLEEIRLQGFPNYFGAQRFGHGGRNIASARSMFQGNRKITRFKRGLYLSAVRSYLFNLVLAARVKDKSWQTVLAGDACILDGTNSVFHCETPDSDITLRNQQRDIHPSGPLYGRGRSMTTGTVAELESSCLQDESLFLQGLEKAGLKQERRSLRAVADQLQWTWLDDNTLQLQVMLQRGVYATAFLRELVCVTEAQIPTDINEKVKTS